MCGSSHGLTSLMWPWTGSLKNFPLRRNDWAWDTTAWEKGCWEITPSSSSNLAIT